MSDSKRRVPAEHKNNPAYVNFWQHLDMYFDLLNDDAEQELWDESETKKERIEVISDLLFAMWESGGDENANDLLSHTKAFAKAETPNQLFDMIQKARG